MRVRHYESNITSPVKAKSFKVRALRATCFRLKTSSWIRWHPFTRRTGIVSPSTTENRLEGHHLVQLAENNPRTRVAHKKGSQRRCGVDAGSYCPEHALFRYGDYPQHDHKSKSSPNLKVRI